VGGLRLQQPADDPGRHPARRVSSTRAICGAIIAAGAFIGLGLASVGIGNRYGSYAVHDPGEAGRPGVVNLDKSQVRFQDLDNPMKLVVVLCVIGVVVGTTAAFIGLMFEHHHRHHELLHLQGNHHAAAPPARATV
jgi:hypothetical protein